MFFPRIAGLDDNIVNPPLVVSGLDMQLVPRSIKKPTARRPKCKLTVEITKDKKQKGYPVLNL